MIALPAIAEAQSQITPTDYAKLLRSVALRDLGVEEFEAKVVHEVLDKNGSLRLSLRRNIECLDLSAQQSIFLATYVVRGSIERKVAFHLRVTYRIVLSVEQQLPAAFWAIYSSQNIDLTAWPFVRELVHATTARMNVPRLLLPLNVHGSVFGPPNGSKLARRRAPAD